MSTLDQDVDGALGAIGIAGSHRVEDRAVQRQGMQRAVFSARGKFETGAQQGTDGTAHVKEQPVASCPQQDLVKAQVMYDIVATVVQRMMHAGKGLLQI